MRGLFPLCFLLSESVLEGSGTCVVGGCGQCFDLFSGLSGDAGLVWVPLTDKVTGNGRGFGFVTFEDIKGTRTPLPLKLFSLQFSPL